MEHIYSLGTVVKIKENPSEYTIIGYCPEDEEKKIHEYIGINAALGLSLRANAACFDEENIEQVVFEGYSDEKGADFRKRLKNMINKYQSRINKTKTADK